jgi:DNA-binding transcriptional LysR family regulator
MFAHINSSIDVRLLRTTYLLLCERNVSRVAVLLGLSQPAVSTCLKKAREIFADPLLVRAGQRLVLTERGEEIKTSIASVLVGLSDALNGQDHFDPRLSSQNIRVAALNCFGVSLVPAIATRIRHEAPQVSLDFFAPGDNPDLVGELGAGRVDVVIGNWPAPQQSLKSTALFHCDIACVVHRGHPLADGRGMSLERYLAAHHISPTPGSSAQFSPIDGRLSQIGMSRHIAMSVPEYAMIPAILRDSDLVFTTARPYAEHMLATTANHDLVLVEAPAELDRMNFYLLWHERNHGRSAHKWLRSIIRQVAKEFHQTLQAPASVEIVVLPAAPSPRRYNESRIPAIQL